MNQLRFVLKKDFIEVDAYSLVRSDYLENVILCTSCASPHTDPDFPRWTTLWVLRNDGLLVSDCKDASVGVEIGSVISLDVTRPHSAMPDFYKGSNINPDKLFVAMAFESDIKPTRKIAFENIRNTLENLTIENGSPVWTNTSLARIQAVS